VRQLAEVVTADTENPYDKTVALERYLRDTITYTLEPPPLPEGRDYVDFLLFETRQDYCNGYASALVVMARSLGIPARLAVGYSQGQYDSERRAFRVRKENAHSWPEVYFPTYGWLEFEPTRSQLPISRPERPPGEMSLEDVGSSPWIDDVYPFDLSLLPNVGADGAGDWAIEPLSPQRARSFWIMLSVFGVVAAAGTGWWALENVGFRGTLPVERAYGRLLRFGRWLGRPPRLSDTPTEWAVEVSAAAPEAREPIGHIVDLYVKARFARGDAAAPEARAAWARARPLLLRGWLRRITRPAFHRKV
jgi:hypothetical protein